MTQSNREIALELWTYRAVLLASMWVRYVGSEEIVVFHEYEAKFQSLGLRNQNSGDAKGDLYFVARGFSLPVECAANASNHDCLNPEQDDSDNVVSQHILQVVRGYDVYAECNPVENMVYQCKCEDEDWERIPCNASAVGRADLSTRYTSRQPDADSPDYSWWRYNLALKFNGFWYSTLARGECHGPDSSSCAWRLVSTVRTIKVECLEKRIGAAVETYNETAFEGCATIADSTYNQSTICYAQAFMATVLGPTGSVAAVDESQGIPNAILESAWAASFADPEDGGCPDAALGTGLHIVAS